MDYDISILLNSVTNIGKKSKSYNIFSIFSNMYFFFDSNFTYRSSHSLTFKHSLLHPQSFMHTILSFLQPHFLVSHSPLQLQVTTSGQALGIASNVIKIDTSLLFSTFHPQFSTMGRTGFAT